MGACFFHVKSSMKISTSLRFRRLIRDGIFCFAVLLVAFLIYSFVSQSEDCEEVIDPVPWQSRSDKKFYIDFKGVDVKRIFGVFESIAPYYSKYYCIVPNVIIPNDTENKRDKITLILHGSIDEKIRVLINHVYNWHGPISIAIVFPSSSVLTTLVVCMTEYLIALCDHHPLARQNLRVHYIFPHLLSDTCNGAKFKSFIQTPTNVRPCRMFFSHVNNFRSKKEIFNGMVSNAYPINVARNVARNYSTSSNIVIADLEHFFSAHFERKMRGLANTIYKRQNKTKLLLTYRIFEVAHTAPVPRTKSELRELYNTGLAQLFHVTYTRIHDYPLLENWFNAYDYHNDMTGIQYMLPLDSAGLEPQFVSTRNIPMHDENFYYPYRDNTVLRWEACRAGFEFAMVHDVFMFHPGIKTILSKLRFDEFRRRITKKSEWAVEKFSDKMDLLYPDTADACPSFRLFQ